MNTIDFVIEDLKLEDEQFKKIISYKGRKIKKLIMYKNKVVIEYEN